MKDSHTKQLKKYVESNIKSILDLRQKFILATGVTPGCLYIGNVIKPAKDELIPSPMLLETGSKVFGMSIIMDFRIAPGDMLITKSKLELPS